MLGRFWSYFQTLWRFLRRLRLFSSQKTQTGPVTGQNKIFKFFKKKLENLSKTRWVCLSSLFYSFFFRCFLVFSRLFLKLEVTCPPPLLGFCGTPGDGKHMGAGGLSIFCFVLFRRSLLMSQKLFGFNQLQYLICFESPCFPLMFLDLLAFPVIFLGSSYSS